MKQRARGWAELHAWDVTKADDASLFVQVYRQIRLAILSQRLQPGSKLPSTRELARQLSVSRSAVVTAYDQLLAEGYVRGKAGSGTYVSTDLPQPSIGRKPKPGKKRDENLKSLDLKSVADFTDVTVLGSELPFNLGRTLPDARTIEQWRKLSARAFRSLDGHHFGYSDPRGSIRLRTAICDYLRVARAVRCEPDQIIVTAGTQHAIDLVIRLLPETNTDVWVEDPGYLLTRQSLAAAGARVYPIPVDAQGINVKAGIKTAPKARAVFVTPSHQFPTGVVLSMARRLELISWARDADAWIVEDDYASEFRYGGPPLASMQGLDENQRVIYVGTLNKALFPGLRLGYAVVPPAMLRSFVTARYLSDRQPSSLSQAIVADFMEEGYFAAHIRRMRLLYRNQRDALVDALRHHLDDEIAVDAPDQGMHLVAYVKKKVSDLAIERAAYQNGVVVRAMSRMYVSAPARSALMLGFSGYPERIIAPAVARLADVIKKQVHPPWRQEQSRTS